MNQKETKRARIGLYSAGLQAYWSQFAGLRDRILGYNAFIESRVSLWGDVVNFGLVDSEVAARKAGEFFNAHNVDIILAHSGTYFTSSCVLPAHQICKSPTVMLNLQPAPQMAYATTDTGEWLAHCVGCPIPEAVNAFERAGISLSIINGLLGLSETPKSSMANEVTADMPQAKRAWSEIEQWVKAAGVKRTMQHARFGFLGNNYSGMLDMYSDFTMLQSQLGLHVELLEMCDLDRSLKQVTPQDVEEKRRETERLKAEGRTEVNANTSKKKVQAQARQTDEERRAAAEKAEREARRARLGIKGGEAPESQVGGRRFARGRAYESDRFDDGAELEPDENDIPEDADTAPLADVKPADVDLSVDLSVDLGEGEKKDEP